MFGSGAFLYADTVIIGTDYVSTGTVDGDLIIVNGSLKITAAGNLGLLVNGDVKIISGSVFMGPTGGKLRVYGDLVVTNTYPNGDASIITHNGLEVSGAIITRSDNGDANITTTGGTSQGTIEAERIITNGYGNSSVYTTTHITVIAEIDTHSTTSDAFVEATGKNLYAGSITTDAYGDGFVEAGDINVIGEIYAQALVGDAYVESTIDSIYAGIITTSGGAVVKGAYVKANNGIEVKGDIRTTSTNLDAYVLATNLSITAGSIITDAYKDAYVSANDQIIVMGDIVTKGDTGLGYVNSTNGYLIASNIITDGYTSGYILAPQDINVRRNIFTKSATGDAYAYSSVSGDILAYSITTSANSDAYVKSEAGIILSQGVINTFGIAGTAYVSAVAGDIFAESIFTNGELASYISANKTIEIKDIIKTKSDSDNAYISAGIDMSARSISTDAGTNGYVSSTNGSINIIGDIRTNAPSGNAYVKALNGNIDARSIKTIAGAASDDSIQSAGGSGRFKLFPNTSDVLLTIKDAEFYLDSDHKWNTQLSLSGTCTINGNGYNLEFDSSGAIVLQAGATLLLKNITIDHVGGNVIRCTDNLGTFSLLNVTLTQTSDVTFDTGSLQIFGDCLITGSGTKFIYESTKTSTINKDSTLMFSHGMTLSYDTNASERIWLSERSSRLAFNGSTLHSVEDIRFTNGELLLDNSVTFSVEAGKSIYLGNGVLADNVLLDFTFGSEFAIYGPLVNQNA
jgi:hypothetical protein